MLSLGQVDATGHGVSASRRTCHVAIGLSHRRFFHRTHNTNFDSYLRESEREEGKSMGDESWELSRESMLGFVGTTAIFFWRLHKRAIRWQVPVAL